MLIAITRSAGFTLIEMMVAVAIVSIALLLGIPSYREWVQNTQIRNAAESIQGGLQRARAEAVGRNSNVAFVLGTDPDNTASWQISGVAEIIESNTGREGTKNAAASGVADDGVTPATTVTFSSLATVVTNTDATATLRRILVDSTVLAPDDSRDLAVTIGTSGVGSNIRMCDPNLSPASSPQACN